VKQHRLPVTPTLAAVYREWWRVLAALRPILLNACLILIAISAAENFVPMRLWNQTVPGEMMTLIREAIQALLLAPILVAIHRFVILNEVIRTYTFPVGQPAFRVFFTWLFALNVLAGLPFDLLGLMQMLDLSLSVSTFGFVVALVAAAAVLLRLTILLPAIAVEAPGARLSRALADTRGQGLRIFAIFSLALLPWLAVDLGGVLLVGSGADVVGSGPAMIGLVMGGVLQTIALSLMAVGASLVFVALAEQVQRAPARPTGTTAT
jgi:hypothetical protein